MIKRVMKVNVDSVMFLKLSLKRQFSINGIGTSGQVKKGTSPSVDDPTIDKCMDILSNLPDIPEGSEIYNYTVSMFLKKDVRQVFLKMTTNEARKSWLEYNYELHLKEM
ncbi:hypothetical protein HAX54_048122 [Datura stramonium]|uniref:Uncharacterized protein n=1 Tax=Datura stramonium TaxID=4076 RepID=A0ABS8ST91_DATST|nr:hypothetical protein [Datura stramonium]